MEKKEETFWTCVRCQLQTICPKLTSDICLNLCDQCLIIGGENPFDCNVAFSRTTSKGKQNRVVLNKWIVWVPNVLNNIIWDYLDTGKSTLIVYLEDDNKSMCVKTYDDLMTLARFYQTCIPRTIDVCISRVNQCVLASGIHPYYHFTCFSIGKYTCFVLCHVLFFRKTQVSFRKTITYTMLAL